FGTSQNDNARDRGCRDDDRSGGGISPLASFAERPRRCSFRLTRPAMERKRFRVMAFPCKPLSMVPSRTQGYDAIVVGAGLSGATLAYRLAKRDLRVLVLERGDFLRLPPWRAGDPIGIHIRSAPARPSVVGVPTKFYGAAMYRMRGIVGGPTKFYGAAMYRMRESDFRAIRHEAGESPAWPITYNDLEPYYCEV